MSNAEPTRTSEFDSIDEPLASWLGLLADLAYVVAVLLLGVGLFIHLTIGWPL